MVVSEDLYSVQSTIHELQRSFLDTLRWLIPTFNVRELISRTYKNQRLEHLPCNNNIFAIQTRLSAEFITKLSAFFAEIHKRAYFISV